MDRESRAKARRDAARKLLGRTLGDEYRLDRILGVGGTAAVFGAVRLSDDATVAVKVRHLLSGKRPVAERRFRREAQVIGRLEHPGCVQLLDWGHDGEVQFTVMELVEGESLFEHLVIHGPVDEQTCLEIVSAICDVLEAAHKLGIAHRDLKPANVMLRRDREPSDRDGVAVLDFGLAKLYRVSEDSEQTVADELTSADVLLGTPSYMAPEQVSKSEIDGRSDLYSLGVMAYEMMSGRRPVMGNDAITIVARILTASPPPLIEILPDVDPEVDAIVMRCLAKSPDDRFPSAAALGEAVDLVLARRNEDAVPESSDQVDTKRDGGTRDDATEDGPTKIRRPSTSPPHRDTEDMDSPESEASADDEALTRVARRRATQARPAESVDDDERVTRVQRAREADGEVDPPTRIARRKIRSKRPTSSVGQAERPQKSARKEPERINKPRPDVDEPIAHPSTAASDNILMVVVFVAVLALLWWLLNL